MKCGKLIILLSIAILPLIAPTAHANDYLEITTDDWPPYEYEENGKVVGFSTEIMEAVLKDMNVNISTLKVYPWARAEYMASEGLVDIIYSAAKSDKRMECCHFPDEHLINSPNVLFIRKEDLGKLKFNSFNDLKGHSVGIVRDYSYTKEFMDYLKNENIVTDIAFDDTSNFKKLMAKRIDYIPADLGNSIGIIKKLNLTGKVHAFLGNPIKTDGLYIMFSKKRIKKSFVDKFSAHLTKFKKTEAYNKIYKKYFGSALRKK